MNRIELQNAIIQLERDLGRNPYHINGSRRKYMDTIYLGEAADELLVAFRAHLENVIKAGVAEQMVVDALNGVELDDKAKKRLGKLIARKGK